MGATSPSIENTVSVTTIAGLVPASRRDSAAMSLCGYTATRAREALHPSTMEA